MFNLIIVTAITLGMVFMPGISYAQEEKKLRCPKNDPVAIYVKTNIAPTQYDYTKTASEIAYMRVIDSRTPFEFTGSTFSKGSLKETIKIPKNILLKDFSATGLYRPHFQIRFNPEYSRILLDEEQEYSCEYFKNLVITMNMEPEIFVVKEAKSIQQQKCFKDILKHEEGHHTISTQHMAEYKQKFYDVIQEMISKNKTYSAPLTKEEEENFYGHMDKQLILYMTKTVFAFHKEHERKQEEFHASPESNADQYCKEVNERAIKNLNKSRLFSN